jgi:hypothetical protein
MTNRRLLYRQARWASFGFCIQRWAKVTAPNLTEFLTVTCIYCGSKDLTEEHHLPEAFGK